MPCKYDLLSLRRRCFAADGPGLICTSRKIQPRLSPPHVLVYTQLSGQARLSDHRGGGAGAIGMCFYTEFSPTSIFDGHGSLCNSRAVFFLIPVSNTNLASRYFHKSPGLRLRDKPHNFLNTAHSFHLARPSFKTLRRGERFTNLKKHFVHMNRLNVPCEPPCMAYTVPETLDELKYK